MFIEKESWEEIFLETRKKCIGSKKTPSTKKKKKEKENTSWLCQVKQEGRQVLVSYVGLNNIEQGFLGQPLLLLLLSSG